MKNFKEHLEESKKPFVKEVGKFWIVMVPSPTAKSGFISQGEFKTEKKAKISLAKFKYTQLHEEVSTATIGAGALAPIKADGKALGMDYFEVDCDKFENCKQSVKKKFKHWNKLLGRKDIQQYAKENKGSFLIKRSGYEQYLRAR